MAPARTAGQDKTVPRRRGRPPLAQGASAPADSGQRVEAVERALTLLEAFTDETRRLSLAELAARSGLYPSTVLRLAASLDRFGYLHRGADGQFRLGATLLRLGTRYRDSFNLADYVRPALAELAGATAETAAFYVREGEQRICLYRHSTWRPVRHHVEEGSVLPLYRGASGRVLVAFTGGQDAASEAIRRDRVCTSLGERDPDTFAVAAPAFGAEGGFLGAIGVVAPRTRYDPGTAAALGEEVRQAAERLSRRIGGSADAARRLTPR